MTTLVVPGTTGISYSPGRLERIAGDLRPCWTEGGRLHVAFITGAAGGGAETLARLGSARLVRKVVNRRSTSAGWHLSLAEGQWFEARGYSRVSSWKRYTRKGDTLVSEDA